MRVPSAPMALSLLTSLTLMGCVAQPLPEIEAHGGAIIGGSATTGVTNVVAVVRSGASGGLCSGTVISRYAVLTAKHCVFSEVSRGRWEEVPAREIFVVVGHDLNRASGVIETVSVREVRTTPGSDVDSDIEGGDDVAVVLLQNRIGVGRRLLGTGPPTRGAEVGIVGFGRTEPGTDEEASAGVKYNGRASVRRVTSRLIETTGSAWTCQGDSGGPLINVADARIVGVTSFGVSGCTRSNSYYARVDRHLGWINPLLSWEPPCMPEPERCGDSVDNDCDGTVDEDCTALGEECAVTDECESGRCEEVDGRRVCVRDCDPRMEVPFCPFGFYCEATACGEGRCRSGVEGVGAAGAECAVDGDCASNRCASLGAVRRCGRQCDVARASCGDGMICEPGDDGCGACLPPELSTRPRPFGVDCATDEECESGLCRMGFCTDACDDASPCPSGFHCRQNECVRGELGGVGDECLDDEDCGEAAPECADVDGDLLCVGPCGAGETCPEGSVCSATSAGPRCVPPGAPLGADCDSAEACRSGLCATVCTRLCGDQGCPEGFVCLPAGEHHGCFPESWAAPPPEASGGCSVSRQGDVSAPVMGLLLVLLLRRRRR